MRTDSSVVASRNVSYIPANEASFRSSAVAEDRTAIVLFVDINRDLTLSAKPTGNSCDARISQIDSAALKAEETLSVSTFVRIVVISSVIGRMKSSKTLVLIVKPGGTFILCLTSSATAAALLPTTDGSSDSSVLISTMNFEISTDRIVVELTPGPKLIEWVEYEKSWI